MIDQWFCDIEYLYQAYQGDSSIEEHDWYKTSPERFMERLRKLLARYPADHGDLNADTVYSFVDDNLGIDADDIRKVVLENISFTDDSASSNPEDEVILHMVKPARCDDWYRVIVQTVGDYEKEHSRTPIISQLWLELKKNPPEEWNIKYHKNGDKLTSPEIDIHLSHSSFNDRYNRYFPKK